MAMRREDNEIRKLFSYKLRYKYGFAPVLPSDTNEERVLKMYPQSHHIPILDVVEGKWGEAYKMVKEQRNFRRNQSDGTLYGTFIDWTVDVRTSWKFKSAKKKQLKVTRRVRKVSGEIGDPTTTEKVKN